MGGRKSGGRTNYLNKLAYDYLGKWAGEDKENLIPTKYHSTVTEEKPKEIKKKSKVVKERKRKFFPLNWTSYERGRESYKRSLKHREDFVQKLQQKHFLKLKKRHDKLVAARKINIRKLPIVRSEETLEKADRYKIIRSE